MDSRASAPPGASAHSDRRFTSAAPVVLLLSLAIVGYSAGDHPLYAPDEGRYASVSLHMAEGASWLVPSYRDAPHLTKPPLAYWAQALSLRLVGQGELAVRLPSLLAAALVTGVLYGLARRRGGTRRAVLAVGVLSLMPLHVVVSRLATTDALLACFWFCALVCGDLAAETGKRRWAAGLWLASGLAWLAKGPLALVAPSLVAAWLLIGGRPHDLRRLRLPIGLPLSLIPIGLWVLLVVRETPGAVAVWEHELLSRLGSGEVAHAEPLWFHLPVAAAGLLPATLLLALFARRRTPRSIWRALRAGEPVGLWALAIAAPLVGFSLLPGKLPTYLLPLCAPAALLSAQALERWLTDEPGAASDTRLGGAWRGTSARRLTALAAVWIGGLVFWVVGFEVEDRLRAPHSAAALVSKLRALTGEERIATHTFGFSDPTLSFYGRVDSWRMWNDGEIERALSTQPVRAAVLLIDDDVFAAFERNAGELAVEITRVGTWQRSLRHTTGVYRPLAAVTADERDETLD